MSIADVKYFNLLVNFGPSYSYNLFELLEQAVLSVTENNDVITLPTSRAVQMRDLRRFEYEECVYLTGLLYKSGEVRWESIPDTDENPQLKPGNQDIMPYARFILSVADHRLFWVTKRGLTKSPTPNDFCQFLKRISLPHLRQTYRIQAEIEWEAKVKEENLEEQLSEQKLRTTKRNYITEYLREFKLTADLMVIRVVPETAKEKVQQLIFEEHFLIQSAVFYPHMNNVTEDDCEELFTVADKVGAAANSEVAIKLSPKKTDEGVKKSIVSEILNVNDKLNLLRFTFKLKHKTKKDLKPVTVSNLDEGMKNRSQGALASIARTAVREGEPMSEDIALQLISENTDMQSAGELDDDLLELIKTKVRETNG